MEKSKILIVDDNEINRMVLSKVLEKEGYEPLMAMSGKQALQLLETDKPELILLDVMMPGMDGFEVCNHLKNDLTYKDIPVIFMTAKCEIDSIVHGFKLGGADYITKPFNASELNARIKYHIVLKQSRDQSNLMNEQLQKSNQKLTEANEIIHLKNNQLLDAMKKLEMLSITDPLTELFNRRYMNDRIEEVYKVFHRKKRGFSILLADIDNFKRTNDTYGHDCGDQVLKLISQQLLIAVRKSDIVSRWGGEEFLILLPDTDKYIAKKLAERIRKSVEKMNIIYNQNRIPISLTIGVSQNENEDVKTMIERADSALYHGKNSGRNCVCVS